MPPAGPEIRHALSAYLKAQAQNIAAIVGLYCIGFALTGVPWWLLTGIVCGLLQQVPWLGSVLALTLAIALRALTTTTGWEPLAWIFGVWLAIQVLDGFVLSPRAAGRAGISPLWSIPLVLVAGFAFGPLGAMLAVPLAAVVLIVVRASRKK
jgi:predicted PurR-regulated permease PerM